MQSAFVSPNEICSISSLIIIHMENAYEAHARNIILLHLSGNISSPRLSSFAGADMKTDRLATFHRSIGSFIDEKSSVSVP